MLTFKTSPGFLVMATRPAAANQSQTRSPCSSVIGSSGHVYRRRLYLFFSSGRERLICTAANCACFLSNSLGPGNPSVPAGGRGTPGHLPLPDGKQASRWCGPRRPAPNHQGMTTKARGTETTHAEPCQLRFPLVPPL